MRALFVHEVFPPDYRGGGESVAGRSALALRDLGVEVKVVTAGNPAVGEWQGLPTQRLPISRYQFNLAAPTILAAAKNVDLIHTYNYNACLPALVAGKKLGIPVILHMIGLFGSVWREMRPFPLGHAWEWIEAFQLRRGWDRIICLSDYARNHALDIGANPKRCVVINPGIEERFVPGAVKQDLVLFTGKFEPRKGVFEVIEVARALPDIPFKLYGWGDLEAELRRIAPPNVEIETYETSERLPAELARARICILPSKAETFGLALIQAMASGCAVVSSIPLPFEGVRVKPTDISGMIEAVRGLWEDPLGAEEMGRHNIDLAKSYTWQVAGRKMLELYQEVLAERGRLSVALR